MGKINFTAEQQQAIDVRDKNILVSAAAGSGKTAVLVERILSIITDPKLNVNIDDFLVVTFTRAAADEMREKINNAISKRLESDPDNVKLSQQLLLLGKASITTIDSFCMSVVKQNFHKANLDPNFKISNSGDISYMVNDVIERLFEEKYQSMDKDFLMLVEYFCNVGDREHTSKIDDFRLANHIKEIYRLANADPYPDKWLENAVEMYNIGENENIFNTDWGKIIKNELFTGLKRLETAINSFRNIALNPQSYCCAAVEKILPVYEELIEKLKDSFETDFDSFIKITEADFTVPMLRVVKADSISAEDKENLKSANAMVKDIYKDIRANAAVSESYIEEIRELYPVVKALIDLTKDFSRALKEEKMLQQTFEHTDIEHTALNILIDENGNPTKTAVEFQNKYYEVIVDEYQDNNSLQEAILSAVSRESQGKYNRFMVGDIKQSIYKFRLARPEMFIEKYETYGKDNNTTLIQLNKNFRSRECILDFVNYVFKQVMCKDFGDLDYTEDVELKYGANYKTAHVPVSENVEMYLIDTNQNDEGVVLDEDFDKITVEAEFVADKIQEIVLEKKEPKVFDSALNDYRDPTYGDIVILLRNDGKIAPSFLSTFALHGIPAVSPKGSNIFTTIEIKTTISILKVIDNPLQDIDLITVLHSPAYNFSGDDLAKIKSKTDKKLFYDCLIEYAENYQDDVSGKINKFLDDFKYLRSFSGLIPVSMLIDKALETTDYINYIRTLNNGLKRQENIKILKEAALSLEENGKNGLFDYLEKLKEMMNSEGAGCNEAITAGENNVQIMSIHASKGLEFPIVFMPQLNTAFRGEHSDIIMQSDFGIAPKFVDVKTRAVASTFPYSFFKKYKENENMSEELRILYVAMTRAKEKLILSGNLGKKISDYENFSSFKETNFGILYKTIKSKSFLKIIMHALMRNKYVLAADRNVYPDNNEAVNDYDLKCKVKIINLQDIMQHKINNTAEDIYLLRYLSSLNSSTDYSGHKAEIYDGLNWLYPYRDVQDLPTKVSISEIKKASYVDENSHEMFDEKTFKVPEFLKEKSELSAANRGTAYHTLMQAMDFNFSNSQQVDALKKQLTEQGKLTQKEADSISNAKIVNFLNGPINEKLRSAKRIYREKAFVMGLRPYDIYKKEEFKAVEEPILVNGIIDLFFETKEGEIILLDYKTDYVPNGDYNIIMNRYKIQLQLYKDAIERSENRKVSETYLYLFGIDKAVKYDF